MEQNYEEKIKQLEIKAAHLQSEASAERNRRETLANSLNQIHRDVQDLTNLNQENLTAMERTCEEKFRQLESRVAPLQDQANAECRSRERLLNILDEVQHRVQALEAAQHTGSQLAEEHNALSFV